MTYDHGLTFDRMSMDAAGVFLVGQLERLDTQLHMPLANVTWSRDIILRQDVSIADEYSSYTNTAFAAAGGASPNGKSWIGKDSTAIAGIAVDNGKTLSQLFLWGQELGWTLPELASSQQLGTPIDSQKHDGLQLKYNMDLDEQVYIGDNQYNVTGLVNSDTKVGLVTNAITGGWTGGATADQIINDIQTFLEGAWNAAAFAVVPTKLLLPPIQFAYIQAAKVSSAGNESILEYVKRNSLCNSVNGIPLDIKPLKWLTGRGVSSTQRMVAYTNQKDYVRFPLVPLQRTPLEYRGINQLTTYFGRLGLVEFPQKETVAYCDGI